MQVAVGQVIRLCHIDAYAGGGRSSDPTLPYRFTCTNAQQSQKKMGVPRQCHQARYQYIEKRQILVNVHEILKLTGTFRDSKRGEPSTKSRNSRANTEALLGVDQHACKIENINFQLQYQILISL